MYREIPEEQKGCVWQKEGWGWLESIPASRIMENFLSLKQESLFVVVVVTGPQVHPPLPF